MERNTCGIDRWTRLIVGTILAVLALSARRDRGKPGHDGTVATWQVLALYAGAELLVTGLVQWCPLNYVLGRDTCTRQ